MNLDKDYFIKVLISTVLVSSSVYMTATPRINLLEDNKVFSYKKKSNLTSNLNDLGLDLDIIENYFNKIDTKSLALLTYVSNHMSIDQKKFKNYLIDRILHNKFESLYNYDSIIGLLQRIYKINLSSDDFKKINYILKLF